MRVELYLVDAMEVASFVPIWRALRAHGVDARIVAVPGADHAGTAGWFDHANATRLLRAADVPFVERADPDSDLAITTQRPWILRQYRRLKARTMYAVGFYEMDGFQAERIHGFDAVFAVGEHARRALARHLDPSRIVVTGYPKYDAFFRDPPSRGAVRARLGLRPTAPVVAYCPTWDEKSSVDAFADAVGAIAETILVKPHHCTVRFEPTRMEALARIAGSVVVSSDEPLADVVLASDLVIVDGRSGVLAEVLLVQPEQPMIVLCPPDDHGMARVDPRLGALCPLVSRAEDLVAVARALLQQGRAGTDGGARRSAVDELFAHRDGSAADRTATAMIDLVARAGRRP